MTSQTERQGAQQIPVKVYRSTDRLTVVAPMPGLEPSDVTVEVTGDERLVLHGELRGTLKDEKDVLADEWNPGPYHREFALPVPVDGQRANVTYNNGVVVMVSPIVDRTQPARLSLDAISATHGERVGHAGQDLRPTTTAAHQRQKIEVQEQAGGVAGRHSL